METIDAIVLGIIQGLTEFLPVSSSGHLELGKAILGDNSLPKESLLFTVVLHFATALSTIVIFRKDILEIIKDVLKFQWNENLQFVVKIIVSMIPAAIVISSSKVFHVACFHVLLLVSPLHTSCTCETFLQQES